MRRLRVATVGELLALTTEELLGSAGFFETTGEVYRALGRRGLRLRDGWPRGLQDWAQQPEPAATPDSAT